MHMCKSLTYIVTNTDNKMFLHCFYAQFLKLELSENLELFLEQETTVF